MRPNRKIPLFCMKFQEKSKKTWKKHVFSLFLRILRETGDEFDKKSSKKWPFFQEKRGFFKIHSQTLQTQKKC